MSTSSSSPTITTALNELLTTIPAEAHKPATMIFVKGVTTALTNVPRNATQDEVDIYVAKTLMEALSLMAEHVIGKLPQPEHN